MVAKGSGVHPETGARRRRLSGGRLAGLGVGAVALLTLLGGCAEIGGASRGFGWPQGGLSPQSTDMYNLWVGSVIAALVVGFLVWGLIFWCVVRYRKKGDELPEQTRYNMPMEILYTVLPVLTISVLFYYTAVVQNDVTRVRPNPDVTVEVVAFKWNWQFNYRDAPGPEANTVASTVGATDYVPVLVLPTNQRIRFEQTSQDVIHSFWVPDLLFKLDVFPGSVRNVWEVTLEREGEYVGRCAELCGTYHSAMNFEVRAVSPERYEQFLAAKRDGLSTPEALEVIGYTGDDRYAVTTFPFETRQDEEGRSR